ncbi:TPX2 family protein, putative isoform 1 [Hibiscus syriacus]|uniref:TPX2 family protein, putative isoform 1 n=1 Tax=Hibiscus syriacus TaxID=106335 RepID=A0A6A2Z4T4_HIBSY|nr:TPX2 family protein, putative isoform 1 [Hibiscus syriacus]
MDETFFDLMQFLKKPTITETFVDILLCAVPIWLAVMIGLVIGWAWRPRWTSLVFLGLRSKFRFIWTAPPGFGARRLWLVFTAPPGFGARRLWLACTALSVFSICRSVFSNFIKWRARKSTAGASNSTVPLQPQSPTVRVSPEGAAGTVRIVVEEIGWLFIQGYFPSAYAIFLLKLTLRGSLSFRLVLRQADVLVLGMLGSKEFLMLLPCLMICYNRVELRYLRSSSIAEERQQDFVTENDLAHLLHLLKGKEGEMEWQHMMEKTTPNMSYQAWRHEPENAPAIYRSRTVFEDATPELVRDFFWDDEFRPQWDTMLSYVKILQECPRTGTMIVHWIKKFPFFCSDREYVITRRIWEGGNAYYCVTKVQAIAVLLQPFIFPEMLMSNTFVQHIGGAISWFPEARQTKTCGALFFELGYQGRGVPERRGAMTACEVDLVHYEDMGIPKDVAKLGVRHGMWGTVKKLHYGLRAYQNVRKTDTSLSRCALMARITTKTSPDDSTDSVGPVSGESEKNGAMVMRRQHDWKWIAVGGTIALVLGLHSGIIGKALLLGAGKRIGRR